MQCEAVAICRGKFAGGLVPGQFEDVETAAEVGGVGEGLKLAESGGVGISLLSEQPVAGLGGEPGSLAGKDAGLAA